MRGQIFALSGAQLDHARQVEEVSGDPLRGMAPAQNEGERVICFGKRRSLGVVDRLDPQFRNASLFQLRRKSRPPIVVSEEQRRLRPRASLGSWLHRRASPKPWPILPASSIWSILSMKRTAPPPQPKLVEKFFLRNGAADRGRIESQPPAIIRPFRRTMARPSGRKPLSCEMLRDSGFARAQQHRRYPEGDEFPGSHRPDRQEFGPTGLAPPASSLMSSSAWSAASARRSRRRMQIGSRPEAQAMRLR